MKTEQQSVNTNLMLADFKELREFTLIEIMKKLNFEGLVLKKNRTLTGKSDVILTAWQMRITNFFTVEKSYLPNYQINLFLRTLIRKISEQDSDMADQDLENSPLMPFIKRYDQDDKYLVAADLLQYFLKEKSEKAYEIIIPILNIFDMATHGVIANCFGDRETVKKIEYFLMKNMY